MSADLAIITNNSCIQLLITSRTSVITYNELQVCLVKINLLAVCFTTLKFLSPAVQSCFWTHGLVFVDIKLIIYLFQVGYVTLRKPMVTYCLTFQPPSLRSKLWGHLLSSIWQAQKKFYRITFTMWQWCHAMTRNSKLPEKISSVMFTAVGMWTASLHLVWNFCYLVLLLLYRYFL